MKRSVVALVNGQPWDMHRPLTEDCELQFLHFKDEDPEIPNQVAKKKIVLLKKKWTLCPVTFLWNVNFCIILINGVSGILTQKTEKDTYLWQLPILKSVST